MRSWPTWNGTGHWASWNVVSVWFGFHIKTAVSVTTTTLLSVSASQIEGQPFWRSAIRTVLGLGLLCYSVLGLANLRNSRSLEWLTSGLEVEKKKYRHFWHILRLGKATGSNNFNDFPDNQLTKFGSMAVGKKEVAVWFQADQRNAGIPYRRIPSHFEPWLTFITAAVRNSRSSECHQEYHVTSQAHKITITDHQNKFSVSQG